MDKEFILGFMIVLFVIFFIVFPILDKLYEPPKPQPHKADHYELLHRGVVALERLVEIEGRQ